MCDGVHNATRYGAIARNWQGEALGIVADKKIAAIDNLTVDLTDKSCDKQSSQPGTTAMTNQEIAKTIISQLGGNRFVAMTGAKNIMVDGEGVSFWIPLSNGINRVNVTLDCNDTYRVTFSKWNARKLCNVIVYTVANVYCDQLAPIFENQTGLFTRL
jgi:hypothetical protein